MRYRRTPDTPTTPPSPDEVQEDLFMENEPYAEIEPVTETEPKLGRKAMILAAAPDPLEEWDYAEPKPLVAPEDPLDGDESMIALLKGHDAVTRDLVIDLLLGLKEAVDHNAPCTRTAANVPIAGRLARLQSANKVREELINELYARINKQNVKFNRSLLGYAKNESTEDGKPRSLDNQRRAAGERDE